MTNTSKISTHSLSISDEPSTHKCLFAFVYSLPFFFLKIKKETYVDWPETKCV